MDPAHLAQPYLYSDQTGVYSHLAIINADAGLRDAKETLNGLRYPLRLVPCSQGGSPEWAESCSGTGRAARGKPV